jgi:hypothetical protein
MNRQITGRFEGALYVLILNRCACAATSERGEKQADPIPVSAGLIDAGAKVGGYLQMIQL